MHASAVLPDTLRFGAGASGVNCVFILSSANESGEEMGETRCEQWRLLPELFNRSTLDAVHCYLALDFHFCPYSAQKSSTFSYVRIF